jgi:cytoskeletal protein CcmA (bactofilin family)
MAKVHSVVVKDGDFGTILSDDSEMSGKFNFQKPLQIRGKISGEIIVQGLVVVEESATVDANIKASRVIIRGTVKGDVIAAKQVDLMASGKLVGYVAAPEIFFEPGSFFEGRCSMT